MTQLTIDTLLSLMSFVQMLRIHAAPVGFVVGVSYNLLYTLYVITLLY
jgi:hypothetical protein